MAGVTDRPFRSLCYRLGADLCLSEMVTSKKHLWNSRKTRLRLNHEGEKGLRSVQIAGTDPEHLAEAARFNVEHGAQIIDINMGCPAKKVCNVLAGSALLKDEKLVSEILSRVTRAVAVPVTLKIRTGWDNDNKNAVNIAKIAEQIGIAALSVHGRTRADGYRGDAEYDTIAKIKQQVTIPIIANGDITSPKKAAKVLTYTCADGIMIGRAAQGNPWIFGEIKYFLATGKLKPPPTRSEITEVLCQHLQQLHEFYGEQSGVRIARKHIGWYLKSHQQAHAQDIQSFKTQVNRVETAQQQLQLVNNFFNKQQEQIAA